MKKVFLSGSRRLIRLPSEVCHRLDEMIRRELTILVGDANGADKAVQTYFAREHYVNVVDVGLALWDGQSTGTLVNVARLVARGKTAVVYVAPQKTFATLKTPDDLVMLLATADRDVRTRAEEYIHDHVTEFAQPGMF